MMTRYHVVTNAETGETTSIPFTPEEEAAADAVEAEAAKPADPVQELKEFLASHPEVAALLTR